MLIGRWAACSALAVVFCAAAGARGDDDEVASIHTVARAAVADGRTVKTRMLGFSIERGSFSETVGRGGVLVGFDLGMRTWFDSEVITAVRPIYRTASGLVTTRDYGSFVEKRKGEGRVPARDGITRVLKLRAKAGYVVSEVRLRTGLGIDAMSLVYQRVAGNKLDPEDTYRSAWIGNVRGGSENRLETGGMPIVGIFGNRDGNDRVNALGVIHIEAPPQRPKVAEKPAVSKPKPVEPPPVPPAEPPVVEKNQPPPEPVPEGGGKRYRDDVRGFKADLPAGWVRLLYLEQQQIKRQSPTLLDAPEMAYRPARAKAPPDTFVLIQSRPLVPGRKLDELAAELTPFTTFREAGGALADQAGGLSAGDMVLDRAKHRFVWKTTTDTPAGRVAGLHVCHVGREYTVTISCHSPAEGFAADLPAYVQVNESFAFDPVQVYRAPADESGAWVMPMLVFLAVSAVIFVPLAVIYGGKGKEAIRRRRAKPAPPAEEVLDAIPVEDEPPAAPSAFAPSTGIVADLTPTSAPLPTRPAQRPRLPAQKANYFTCYLGATDFSRELTYHVYALPGEVYFLEADGRDSGRDDLTADDLFALADGDTSFRAQAEDLVKASLDAVGFWDVLGGDALGKLRLLHATRGELTFDFRNVEQMRRAIEQLPAALGELLVVNAVYDRRSKKFVQSS